MSNLQYTSGTKVPRFDKGKSAISLSKIIHYRGVGGEKNRKRGNKQYRGLPKIGEVSILIHILSSHK